MSMPVAGWIGGGVAGTGSAMQFMAQGKRERAQNRVAGEMRAETAQYGQERYDISDTLRRALDSIAQARTGNTEKYLENRNSPERQLAAEQMQNQRIDTAQGGLNKAMAALNGPSNAYRGADSTTTPGAAVMSPDQTGNPASPFDESLATYGRREQPLLHGILQQLYNQGYLQGGANFDTQNQQSLAMHQAPLDNEMLLRQLLTGVRQGEAQYSHETTMAGLQRAMEAANRVGGTEMLWGSILQNVGTGIAGGTDFNYQSANGGSPAEANPSYNPNEGQQPMSSAGTVQGGGNGTGGDVGQPSLSMPYEYSDYVPNYGGSPGGFASNGAGTARPLDANSMDY
jgi:hypothetical protein